MKHSIIASLAVGALASMAVAQPVVPTPLSGGTQGGFVAGDYYTTSFSTLTWFTFTLTEPTMVNVDFDRTTAPPDLYATLYSGDITGLDATAFAATHSDAWFIPIGSLTWLDIQDDTDPNGLDGPYGDPRFTNLLPAGTYSIVVSALQGAGGTFQVTSNVPTPAAATLLGLGGLASLKRRRR
jgi:MYXO-CTERM domain-containing protein